MNLKLNTARHHFAQLIAAKMLTYRQKVFGK